MKHMKIAVTMPVLAYHKTELEKAAPEAAFYYGKDLEKLKEAEVILGNIRPEWVNQLPKLRWLQLNSAGADAYCKPGVTPEDVQLTNATGAYGQALSEHMLALTLAMMKKLYRYYDNQKQGLWHDEGTVTSLKNAVVLVIGFGDIGKAYARLVKAMGAYVIGVRRRHGEKPAEADEMCLMEHLPELLARADIVASVLPGTPATTHLYDAKLFGAMKQGAYFINVGRGSAVVQKDLRAALESGHLAGAAVDVTEVEPLPQDDPLWHTPNMYITPHIAGDFHLQATQDNIVHIEAANLRRYVAGEPLQNIVDRKTGYKK